MFKHVKAWLNDTAPVSVESKAPQAETRKCERCQRDADLFVSLADRPTLCHECAGLK